MKISKVARREAKELFRVCLVNGELNEERVRQVVRHVATAKPRGYFAILSHFERLVKLEIERRTARVESATALTSEQQGEITGRFNQLYGAGLNISFAQNPALLGGLKVQVGSDVFDGSVKGRLDQLAESF